VTQTIIGCKCTLKSFFTTNAAAAAAASLTITNAIASATNN